VIIAESSTTREQESCPTKGMTSFIEEGKLGIGWDLCVGEGRSRREGGRGGGGGGNLILLCVTNVIQSSTDSVVISLDQNFSSSQSSGVESFILDPVGIPGETTTQAEHEIEEIVGLHHRIQSTNSFA
jgi:hypothetical protein